MRRPMQRSMLGRPIHELHRSTFHLKLMLQLGKLLSHNVALCHPPLRQMQDNHILVRGQLRTHLVR